MVDAAPFRGLRYDPTLAGDPATTSAPAYSDLEPAAYAEHRTASPYTVLELMAGGPPTADTTSPRSYQAAGTALARWRRTGVLVADPRPAFYRYDEHWIGAGGVPARQRGILAAITVGAPPEGLYTHEDVDPQRVEERLARLRAVPADLAPVFGLAADPPPLLQELLDVSPSEPPVAALTDAEGVDHRVWRIDDAAAVAALRDVLADTDVVIADGHHRYAAASAAHSMLGDAAPPGWHRTLVDIVVASPPHDGPRVQGMHRLAPRLPALDPSSDGGTSVDVAPVAGGLAGLRRALASEDGPAAGLLQATGREPQMALLRPPRHSSAPASSPAALRTSLDAVALEQSILPALHIDPATLQPTPDIQAATAAVAEGRADGVFLVRPVAAATVLELARAELHLPAKTTWFWPKPRAGLVLRALDE